MVELLMIIAVIGLILTIGTISFQSWVRTERARGTTRQLADLVSVTRAEAIRTNQIHVVYFGTDDNGDALTDSSGQTVVALAIADLDGDGSVDDGERFASVPAPPGNILFWGHAQAQDRAMGDPAGSDGDEPAASITFTQPDDSAATWVAIFPDGTPRAYVDTNANGSGGLGSGAGAVYVSNGTRDYAVVISPLGAVSMQTWDPSSDAWRR